jgi:phage I-like protein
VGSEAITFARLVQLAELAEGEPLPTEFQIFAAGVNESSQGPALFDDVAAKSVMSAWAKWGVDLMIDIDHASLDMAARAARRDSGDAAGWFRLEIREGALMAVRVGWNSEGTRQLREKLRRYISPAFFADEEGRVTEIVNVALVAMPATYGAQPLIAASRGAIHQRNAIVDPKQVQAAIDALIAEDAKAALEILKALIVSAAGGEPETPPEEDASAEPADVPPPPEDVAAMGQLRSLLGKASAGEIVAAVEALQGTASKVAADAAAVELSARRELVGTLVKLGVELPATAWAGDATARNPVKRLLDEPIAELRARVQAFSAARRPEELKPPTGSAGSDQLDRHTKGMSPEQKAAYLALRARRDVKGNAQ